MNARQRRVLRRSRERLDERRRIAQERFNAWAETPAGQAFMKEVRDNLQASFDRHSHRAFALVVRRPAW